jgi:sodium transport system permease protein
LDLVAFALVPAACEEVAFRGFILTGLHRRFRSRNAILCTAFLFALFHLNVFLFVPAFALGAVLGLLTVRSRSIVPAVLLHFLYNALLLTAARLPGGEMSLTPGGPWPWLAAACLAAAAMLLWWLYRQPYEALARLRHPGPPDNLKKH